MIATFLVALREYLEVFLIVGVFFGISRKLSLNREREIIAASILGILISLVLPTVVFALGEKAGSIFNEKNSGLLEGYLMIFSGFFIAYVVFSLHNFFVQQRSKAIIFAHQKMQQNIFDVSTFLTIVFFIIREGFEIALFTGTTSLFSRFVENIAGLFLGFSTSALLGLVTYFAYTKFPLVRIFKITEYLIIVLGASFVKNGLTELTKIYLDLRLSEVFTLTFWFLPAKTSFLGHLIKNLFGLERQLGFWQLIIMGSYLFFIYFFFLKKEAFPKR